ncbi:hypothetical protein PGT21_007031 [Puccinia graminis f. sp. tritici]|uniref:Uncharacterized protein n=1 Tax=Puccinia graminis f. sp. tritici TaxID=56615 RepID=A0A5B0QXJ6_PUCGR|nr:hypothetical protein PGT21_007031 [Puccinia graminis f. sp. tritici]
MSKDESAAAAAQEMPHTIGQVHPHPWTNSQANISRHRLKAENSLAGQWPVSACLSASLRQTAADKCQSAVHTPPSRLDCDFVQQQVIDIKMTSPCRFLGMSFVLQIVTLTDTFSALDVQKPNQFRQKQYKQH